MPPRFSNPAWRYGFIILGISVVYSVYPDPPAVQEAQARKYEQLKRRREEEQRRTIEQRIDKFEQENPGWLEAKWPGDNDNDNNNNNNEGSSQDRS